MLYPCKYGSVNKLNVKTQQVTLNVNQQSYTVPSDRKLLGVTGLSVVLQGGFWHNPSLSCNLETGVITIGGGGSTVDTKRTFTITYSYTDKT